MIQAPKFGTRWYGECVSLSLIEGRVIIFFNKYLGISRPRIPQYKRN